jgi:hypothetical protein
VKTGYRIYCFLRDNKGIKYDIGQIARHVPGKTKKQISCALTRLVNGTVCGSRVKYETPDYTRHVAGNNKPNRVYWV